MNDDGGDADTLYRTFTGVDAGALRKKPSIQTGLSYLRSPLIKRAWPTKNELRPMKNGPKKIIYSNKLIVIKSYYSFICLINYILVGRKRLSYSLRKKVQIEQTS